MEIFEASQILSKKLEKESEKCRMCHKVLLKNKVFISKAVQKKFHDVTQLELPISSKYPKFICSKCDKELDEAQKYRDQLLDVLMKQHKEIGEVPQTFEPEMITLKQERTEMDDDDFFGDSFNFSGIKDENEDNESKSKKRRSPDVRKSTIVAEKKIDETGRAYYECEYCGMWKFDLLDL
jgi:DNA-directed RNA polymerase subunit RPC12/RpoP